MKRKIEQALRDSEPEVYRGRRKKPMPETHYELVDPASEVDASITEALEQEKQGRKVEYVTMLVHGSKGQTYRITVSKGIGEHVPKQWRWDARKLRAAELIAMGVPVSDIVKDPEVGVKSRAVIYGWYNHPEFKEHVDALVMETGFAAKRERIAGMKRVTRILFDKLTRELGSVKMTDKSVGSLLSGFTVLLKQLAQEKEEFVEQARVENEVNANVKGTMTTTSVPLEKVLENLPKNEREEMEQEISKIVDQLLPTLRGDTPIKLEGENEQ